MACPTSMAAMSRRSGQPKAMSCRCAAVGSHEPSTPSSARCSGMCVVESMSETPPLSSSSATAASTAWSRRSCRSRRYQSRMARQSGRSRTKRSGSCMRVLATRPTMTASLACHRRSRRIHPPGRYSETSAQWSHKSASCGSAWPLNATHATSSPCRFMPRATSTGSCPSPAMSPIVPLTSAGYQRSIGS